MKKKLNILGKKVPVLAVMIALMVIGTASAALIVNYATLTGDVTVDQTIFVVGNDQASSPNPNLLVFTDGVATFTIENEGTTTNVEVNTALYLDPDGTGTEVSTMVTDTTGLTVSYTPGTPTSPPDAGGVYDSVIVEAPGGVTTTVTVTLGTNPGVETGVYTVYVDVDPIV